MNPEPIVFVVDDDVAVRESLEMLLRASGYQVRAFGSAAQFLSEVDSFAGGCLIADIRMPEMDGLELQGELGRRNSPLPVIVVTGHGDVPLAVRAMKQGATDFIEKPFRRESLLAAVRRALEAGRESAASGATLKLVRTRLATLTEREREVYEGVVAGKQSKTIAFELGSSPRTVEIQRAKMMHKMRANNLQELVRMAILASG